MNFNKFTPSFAEKKGARIDIETPAVLKTGRRSSRSPVAMSRARLPPSRSGLLQNLFSLPQKAEVSGVNCAVVVFGFPQRMKDLVLDKFRKFGVIEEVKESQGNWVKITYNDSYSVSKALAFNLQYIADGVLIGVKPYGIQEKHKEKGEYMHQSSYASTSQYLKKVPRRKASIYEKFVRYILNFDSD